MILNSVYKRLALAIETISFDRFYEMMMSGNPIEITWEKLDGTNRRRILEAGEYTGNAKYDYEAEGYMVLQRTNGEWNTVDLSSVSRCRFQGKTYMVR